MRWMLVLACVTVGLTGCGSAKLLGSQTPPDETQVIDGPTLAVPPDFELRPPTDTEDYEAVLRAQKTREAQTLIVGGAQAVSATVQGTDQWLLKQAGGDAVSATGDIRTQLKDDAAPKADDEKTFWQRIMGKDKKE